jgi:RecA/RadA recombinase
MNKQEIIEELGYFEEYAQLDLSKMELRELDLLFSDHCKKYSEEVEIIDIFENLFNNKILADTPDGWIEVGDFYKKTEREIHKMVLNDGSSADVSCDHLFETSKGWKKTNEISSDDLILTKTGFIGIKSNSVISKEEVYDWEILHENHRYWVGNMSSHNTGKSFVCLNVVREAQKKGYDVIYCDTEGAIDKSTAAKFGIDQYRIRYQPIKTVTEFQTFVTNLLELVKKAKESGGSPKILLIVDSLGMLSTDKELNDAMIGKNAADMGEKAKELRKLCRVITLDLTAARIPLIATNHVYAGGGFFPTKESSGGDGPIFAMSVISFLSKAQLKEGNSSTKTGIIVTSNLKKSRFTIPEPVKFHISFANGMNPYVGLQDFVNWEACGIERGKLEEVKNKDGVKEMVFTPNASSTRWAVKHLGKTVTSSQLFTSEIFTQEVLENLDKNVIQKHFLLPSMGTNDEISEALDSEMEDPENGEE